MASLPPESSTDHPTDDTAPAASAGDPAADDPAPDTPGGAAVESPVDAPVDAPVEAPAAPPVDAPVDAADDAMVDAAVDDLGVDELLLDAPPEDEGPAGEVGVDPSGGIGDDWDTDSDVPLADWDGTSMDVPVDVRRPSSDSDGEDDWGGTDWDGTVWDGMDVEPAAALRTRRRRWRRRRRALGTLAFLLVVAGLGVVVARAAGVGEDDGNQASATTTTAPPTTSTLPPAGPYRVIDGLNVRSGPSSTATVLGTIKIGETVMVLCVADGDLVNGPRGQSTKWLKITTPFGPVFVTAAYVAIGADLTNSEKIAPCTA